MRVSILVALCFACSSPSPPTQVAANRAVAPTMQRALAFERGAGIVRDYAQAVAIYEQLCSGGRGNARACQQQLFAASSARGYDAHDRDQLIALARALCERQHNLIGCSIFVSGMAYNHASSLPPSITAELEHPAHSCDAGDVDACVLAFAYLDISGSSGRAAKRRAAAERACKEGLIIGCVYLVQKMSDCAYEPGAGRCVEHVVAQWREDQQRTELDAAAALGRSCDLGDAEACAALPGRELPRGQLCDAHDYGACAELACLGDAAAGAIATAHGGEANCTAIENREQARTAPPPPPPRPPPPADPEPGTITPSPAPPLRSLQFRQLGKRDDYGWQTYDIYNLSNRTVDGLTAVIYAYDANDAQVAMTEFPATVYGGLGLAPGAHTHLGFPASRPPPDSAVAFEACYASISFAGERTPHLGRCPQRKKRGERWGNGGDVVAVTVNNRSSTTYPDDFDRVLIEDFERTHPGVLLVSDPTTFLLASVPLVISTRPPEAGEVAKARGGPMISVPLMFTPVAVRYHLANIPDLKLSAASLAKIFQRDIKAWNDPAIAMDNPGVALPALPIVVVRPGGAAAAALVEYVRRAGARWHVDLIRQDGWPADTLHASTDDQLAQLLVGTDGAIGLTTPRAAAHTDLPPVRVRNGAGAWVAPSAEGATRAAAKTDAAYTRFFVNDAAAYPIVYVTWVSTYAKASDRDVGGWIRTYLRYLVGEGQAVLGRLGYGVLPRPAATRALATVAKVVVP